MLMRMYSKLTLPCWAGEAHFLCDAFPFPAEIQQRPIMDDQELSRAPGRILGHESDMSEKNSSAFHGRSRPHQGALVVRWSELDDR
jgi:hypothetical protein